MQRRERRERQDVTATRAGNDDGGSTGPRQQRGHRRSGAQPGRKARRAHVPLLVGLALALALVMVAPAPPASAYVQPYGRYRVKVSINDQCLTVPFNGVPGTFVIRATCTGASNQNWHFDRVSTWSGGLPVFEIRATHRVDGYGNYSDCLDLPYGDPYAGRPIWTWPCNGGDAQKWIQIDIGHVDSSTGQRLYYYASVRDPLWIMQFNNNEVYPHLVMVPTPSQPGGYNSFFQQYVG